MNATEKLNAFLKTHAVKLGNVVDFNADTDLLYQLDLTANNKELTKDVVTSPERFDSWITEKLHTNNCRYGIGGYLEHRTIYNGIPLFESAGGARLLHLGIDIWGEAGTQVYSPLAGKVHSFKDNNQFGDYGPAIVLEHDLDGLILFSLFGHLSRPSLEGLSVGMNVQSGQKIGSLGELHENGNWPPHLHFQLMFDMEGNWGDYPGACLFAEKEKYLKNIPDPQLLLRLRGAINA